jgi:hypothetical protein
MQQNEVYFCPRKNIGCKGIIPDNMDHCPTCSVQVAAPNFRAASHPSELEALEKRYREAAQKAQAKGLVDELMALEQKLEGSQAVVCVSYSFLSQMLEDNKQLYTPYQQLVRAGVRKPSVWADDKERMTVEGALFGSIGGQITYAALSANSRGLPSYGAISITLHPSAYVDRSSLMELNSYEFFRQHLLAKSTLNSPKGYITTWQNRSKLGIAKLAEFLDVNIHEAKLETLILSSDGDRGLDKFIEIHIFGSFDNRAIAKVVPFVPPKERRDKVFFEGFQDICKKLEIDVQHV